MDSTGLIINVLATTVGVSPSASHITFIPLWFNVSVQHHCCTCYLVEQVLDVIMYVHCAEAYV
eukprot:6193392-Pleurochrysis_carterae.AAC.1